MNYAKTPRVDEEIIKNGNSFCAFKRKRTRLDGQKQFKNATWGRRIFEKRKKTFVFSNENGYVTICNKQSHSERISPKENCFEVSKRILLQVAIVILSFLPRR